MVSQMEFTCQTAIFALPEQKCAQGSCLFILTMTALTEGLTVERLKRTDLSHVSHFLLF